MFDLIFGLPNSRLIFIGTIITSVILVLLFIGTSLYLYTNCGPTLTQWIDKLRKRGDAASASKLKRVRTLLEILAHDVLKHRLLGLISLSEGVKSVKKEDGKYELTAEQLDRIREEMFRLCGVKSAPEDRLWRKWTTTFMEIRQLAHYFMVSPFGDPLLKNTARVMLKLHKMFSMYVSKENAEAVTPKAIAELELEACGDIYQRILDLASGCRMVVEPQDIVARAMDMISIQTERADALKRIHVESLPKGKWLCTASSETLSMCLMRVIDNALSVGGNIKVTARLSVDDFTGSQFLMFRVYDSSDKIPDPVQYGLGLRGVLHEMNEFDGGFMFRNDAQDNFKKAAVLSVPVYDYREIAVQSAGIGRFIPIEVLQVFIALLAVFCLARITGGLPVEFAGVGTSIIEFPVEVGHELVIPLCVGGSNVSATIEIDEKAACWEGNCSLYSVLEQLRACAKGIDSNDCPGEIRWTPLFEDGKRQGKSYDLTVHCISAGPPASEDSKNIRILVSRPNTAPQIIQTSLENVSTDKTVPIVGKPVDVAAADRLVLHAVAIDSDADVIQYKLTLPDGKTSISYDGVFPLNPDWGAFTSWTAELEVTDNIAKPIRVPIQLHAETLHTIELRNIAVWQPQNNAYASCYSVVDAQHVCNFGNQHNDNVRISVWFDPLQKQIRPQFSLELAENAFYAVRFIPISGSNTPGNQIGDRWEIYDISTGYVKLTAELTFIEKTSVPGVYDFVFNVTTSPEVNTQFPLAMRISELSGKLPEDASFVLFNFASVSHSDVLFSNKNVYLREYELDEDSADGRASVAFYSVTNPKALKPSFGNFTCTQPEFEKAFEPISFKKSSSGWYVDFRLKNGCIHGLTSKLDSKARLCALELFLDKEKQQSETIWVTLEDRHCTPHVSDIKLTSSQEQLDQNIFQWHFKVSDPDLDLRQDQIQIVGNTPSSLFVNRLPNDDAFYGIAMVQGICKKSFSFPKLQIHDESGLLYKTALSAKMNCASLVALTEPKKEFYVENGELLKLPLTYDVDVSPRLTTRPGKIVDDAFVWEASCLYGKGPLKVSIVGDSEERIGDPLNFFIYVNNCRPEIKLKLNGEYVDNINKIVVPVGKESVLSFDNVKEIINDYYYVTTLENDSSEIAVSTDSETWDTTIICPDEPSVRKLHLFVKHEDHKNEIKELEIHCIKL